MKVLGIDPGTIIMGYGIIENRNDDITLVDYGVIRTKERSPIGERLSYLYGHITEIIARYQPDAVAVEQPFVAKNAKSAFAIGRAQAVAILAAANSRIPCFEYTPAEVKQKVRTTAPAARNDSANGDAATGAESGPPTRPMQRMHWVALCHLQAAHLQNLLDQQEKP
jgi:crossover junction endodeoxyribonuclease RuvC